MTPHYSRVDADHGTLMLENDEPAPKTAESNSSGINGADAPQVDLPRIQRAVREILAAVGEDPDREGLKETPRAWRECMRNCFPVCGKIRMSI